MFKRYASYSGGTCDPLVIHWPAGIKAKGELRHQYHHCTDIVPTILECCGVPMPDEIDCVKQAPLPGVSMAYSFDAADSPTAKEAQYYEMTGTRGIWYKGWKASAQHGPLPSDQGKFDQDVWELFHTDEDRAEAHDLAAEHPEKLKELQDLWFAEATKNNVLPLIDLGIVAFHAAEFHAAPLKSGRYTYYPGTTEVPEASAARTLGASFKALAEVTFTGDTEGVIFAQGSRFGGYSLFVKGRELVFAYNFLGIPPEQQLRCPAPRSGKHLVGVEFAKAGHGQYAEAQGKMTLYIDDKPVADGDFRTQSGHYALCGEGLAIGRDAGDAVSSEYGSAFDFSGGKIEKVIFDIADDHYLDVEQALAAALARD
jgi:arylsulfatase